MQNLHLLDLRSHTLIMTRPHTQTSILPIMFKSFETYLQMIKKYLDLVSMELYVFHG